MLGAVNCARCPDLDTIYSDFGPLCAASPSVGGVFLRREARTPRPDQPSRHTRRLSMIIENETPPSIAELLEAAPPTPQHIALNVRVTGRQGERAYWMTEGGTVFFRN